MPNQTISIFRWMGGVIRTTPALPHVIKGLWNLVTLKPDQVGSIGQRFANQAKAHPDRLAVTFEGRRWTYGQFNAWANQIAWSLQDAGIKKGDAVGVLMENRPEMLACVLGIVKLGAIATLLNNQQRGEPLAHSLRITKPRVVIIGDECMAGFDSLSAETRQELNAIWWWDGEDKGKSTAPAGMSSLARQTAHASTGNPPQTAQITLRTPCFHVFTSGTTGLPKASVMTHYRWHRCMAGLGQLGLRLNADDVLYCPLPLYHNNALTVSWSAVIGAGACLALSRKFSASRFWDDIRATQATAFCYIGELCRYLLNQPERASDTEHKVRGIIGNGLRPDIWPQFQQRFGIQHIAEFYTASECNLAFVNAFGFEGTAGYCPLPHAIVSFDVENEVPLRQADSTMVREGKGGVGLLLTEITDKAPLDGYTDAKATQAKVFRDVFNKGDAWFNTGDLVRNQGFGHIQFVDRVGDTFRWKGENVATTEVEAALGCIDGISEAVVYGVEVPGADGRAGMAAICWDESKGALDGVALAQALYKALPKYAVPLYIRVRDEHEVTATFKHRKVELKREGFDAGKVSDALYALGERGYEVMRAEAVARRA